ncbi:carbohydrate ABC transporter permease [Tessaracoccus terricola]
MQLVRKSVLVVLGVIWLIPIYLMLVNAAKVSSNYGNATVWVPSDLTGLFENFLLALDRGRIAEGLLSTLIYSVVSPTVAVVIGAMAGFAIVALKLRRPFMWFVIIFCATVFPIQMVLMPLFMGYVGAGIFDTRIGMLLIYTVISVPFSAFVLRNFFSGIAHSVYEAAELDGATPWKIFFRIYLPMSKSALFAVFILQATFVWNDLLLGLSLSQSSEVRPVMTTLAAMQSTYGGSTMPVVLAGGLLVSLPTIALFLLTQRYFTQGLSLGQYN